MFGKKGTTTTTAPPPPPKVDAKAAAPVAVKSKESSPSEATKKPEKEAAKKKPANGAAEADKPASKDDPFAEMQALGHKDKPSDGDSITTIRLQRARNRIWLDLRDGIDLKSLARMDSKTAREEVYSAVQEIARFRNLDLTPAELSKASPRNAPTICWALVRSKVARDRRHRRYHD
jgi:pilus assembly protein CpaF